jgi:hypothetical protein
MTFFAPPLSLLIAANLFDSGNRCQIGTVGEFGQVGPIVGGLGHLLAALEKLCRTGNDAPNLVRVREQFFATEETQTIKVSTFGSFSEV